MKRVTSFMLLIFFLISTTGYSQEAGSGLPKAELEKVKLARMQVTSEQAPGTVAGPVQYTDTDYDLQFEYPCGDASGEAGTESDGNYIYTTKWNGSGFFKYGLDGTFYGSFQVGTVQAIRDLAFDGTYMYGAAANTTVYQMDFNTLTVVSTMTAGTATRAIAYDEGEDAFWSNHWSTPIVLWDRTGAVLATIPTAGDESYYGLAYDPQGPYLWGYSQRVGTSLNMLYKMALPDGTQVGSFDMLTILTIPVTGTEVAGGLYFHPDLVQGTNTLGGIVQNICIWGVEMGLTLTIDVGVTAFVSPASGTYLGNETVTITVKNFGANSASNIPVSYTLDGSVTVTGTLAGPIASGATANFTFPGTVNLGNPGQTYSFVGCTALAGDENPGNNCKTHNVTNVIPTYCDASTSVEDEYIANVLCGDINNSSGWQGGVADYTDITTTINAGEAEDITITNGNAWAADIVYCWADWNKDFEFGTGDELFMLTNVGGTGQTFTGTISVPASVPNGEYRFRIRMTYSTAPTPCGSASYGEIEDYTIVVGNGIPILNPPSNLTGAYVAPNSAQLNWSPPEIPGEWLSFCGPNDDGLGVEGGGTFYAAAHWTPAQLAPYIGQYMTKASIFPTSTDNATYVLMVWTGATAGTLVVNQPLNGLVMQEWNDIVFGTPVVIGTTDIWVGYQVTHNDGDNPAGMDAGPAIAGYGDMVSFDGLLWESMVSIYGLDYNFNIEAFVTQQNDGEIAQPLPNIISNNPNQSNQLVVGKMFNGNSGDKTRTTLTGYNVYRDDMLIDSTLNTVTNFLDSKLVPGVYSYKVTAVYDEGESEPAGPVEVAVGEITILVAPNFFEESLETGTTSTHEMIITNNGDLPLIYSIEIEDTSENTYKPALQEPNPPDSPEAIARLLEREAQNGLNSHSLKANPYGSKIPACMQMADLKGLRGELAYGNNVEGNTFYDLDVETLATNVIGSTTYAAFCGDFAPGDVNNMYIIDYNDDYLKMVDISTGVATPIASVPCPMAGSGGIWTELAIDKTTGVFYAAATDINVSNLYTIDPGSGAVTLVGNCGIAAVISCTIDLTGTMYAFDIVSDNTYTIDLATGVGTLLGPSGFNGNYAQGMGYDAVNDAIYLAAYSTFAELRLLDKVTGATISLGTLPGQTGAFGFPYSGVSYGTDVGVTAFISPVSGPYLGNETVTIRVKNLGTNSASNVPVSYTLNGGAALNGTLAGPIASGATADFTFPGTVNLGSPGQTYVFVGCTALAGDENPGNNCKTTNVTNVMPTYCDASTSTDDEYIANVLCGSINNSSGWQGGVANYTDITTQINAGMSEAITITNPVPYASDIVYCWADWNKDFTFGTGDEQFMLTNVGGTGQTFTGAITVPVGVPNGEYRFRIRMTYSTAPVPCGDATYGEVEDYTIVVGGITNWLSVNPVSGTVPSRESANLDVIFNAQGIPNGFYYANILISSNATNNPLVTIPAQLVVYGGFPNIQAGTTMLDFGEVAVGNSVTQSVTISNTGTDVLIITGTGIDNPDFSLVGSVNYINPGSSFPFEIEFSPSSIGPISGILTITSNDPDQPPVNVDLFGSGYLEAPQNLYASVWGYDVTLNWDPPYWDQSKALLGYNVYKDGYYYVFTSNYYYDDYGVTPGEHQYQVSALYDEGESELTPPVFIFAGEAVISVSPDYFDETLETGTSATYQMTITNSGTLPLDYALEVGADKKQHFPEEATIVGSPDSPEAIALIQAREAQDGIAPPSLGFDPLGSRVPAGYKPADLKGLRGEIAYGNNVEGNTFYDLDVETLAATVIGSTTYAAFCGDFAPGDVDNMYIIDYNDDVLKMVDIATGVATPIASVPCPMAPNGIWTELAIDKNDGTFYATATDINVSNLYTIDPNSGAITLVGNMGIAAVISCTIDLGGTMYAFDIVSDNCYTVNLATGVGTLLGPAGFNGNYAQGMGYDAVNDKVYLAAYSTFAELRELNTSTGATTALGALPGETGAFGFPYMGGPQSGVDVGVTAFVSPVSGPYLGNETVTIKVKNFGTNSASNIPVSYTLDGGAAVTGTLAGPIASGTTVDFTFPGTVNLGNPGHTYIFVGCTALAGDENSNNNCKTANVTHVIPTYCDATTQIEDEYIANVLCGDINNSSGWQGGVADFTNISTTINAGESEEITVTNGNAWASDIVYCWADWNEDFTFGTGDEQFMLTNVGGTGQTFTGTITVPANVPNGQYRFRIRMTYSTAPVPCGDATYGEIEDYTIIVGGISNWLTVFPTYGTVEPGQTAILDVTFDATGLVPDVYSTEIEIWSNDPDQPYVYIPATLTVTEPEPVIADFSAAPLSGSIPLTVNFSDQSSGNILLWEWDFDNDGSIDSYLQNPEWTYTTEGVYSVKLTVSNTLVSDFELKTDYIFVVSEPTHFLPIWTSPYNPMTFYVLAATIDEITMENGDEIGLFDIDPNTGEEICVGAGLLSVPLTGGAYLEIIASMDDGSVVGQANGFTPGNEILYKLWSDLSGETSTVSATYPYPGYDEVYTSQGTAFVELNGFTTITQEISLQTGWNIMSFRVEPMDWNMLNIVQPLINQNVLFKVLDEAGGSIFHLPFPPPNGQWSNTIGNMENTEGYYVKVTGDGSLSLEGYPIETPMDIPLTTGWNIISYPCEFPQNALTAVQPLIDAGVLFKVIDEAGGTIFHLPFPPPNGQWSNTIGNFESGEGYYVKVTGNATLNLSCPTDGGDALSTVKTTKPSTSYFNPVFTNNPFMPMDVILKFNQEFKTGDEIAIFDGEVCVGASVITGNNDFVIITCSQDDTETPEKEGFIAGNNISVKGWDNENQQVFENIFTEYLTGDEVYSPLGTSIHLVTDVISNLTNFSSNQFAVEIYPNPVTNQSVVWLTIPTNGTLELSVTDLLGKEKCQIFNDEIQSGFNKISPGKMNLKSGFYFLKYSYSSDGKITHGYLKFISVSE